MCILFMAVGKHPTLPLVIASNRDEFTARATLAPGLGTAYPDTLPHVIAGKDLRAGGTWSATDTLNGRSATVLNVAPSVQMPAGSPSRGALPLLWIDAPADATPLSFLEGLFAGYDGLKYAGFSLIVSSVQPGAKAGSDPIVRCAFGTNAHMQQRGMVYIQDLSTPGVFAFTNDGAIYDDTIAVSELTREIYWPKARRGHALMTNMLEVNKQKKILLDSLISNLLTKLLGCDQVQDEHSTQRKLIGGESKTGTEEHGHGRRDWEDHISAARQLAVSAEVPIFLSWGTYATRTSTLVMFSVPKNGKDRNSLHLHYVDQGFDANGACEPTKLGPFLL